jgi:Zn-finger nucleic acid-binding protein
MAIEARGLPPQQAGSEVVHCPVCGKSMVHQIKQDVEVSVCAEHGVWLDKGKIEALTKSVRERTRHTGDLIRHAEVEEASAYGQGSGILTGWLARLFH